jgi:hypothetical protein
MFGPKNTARDVAATLIAGLTDGSIVLRHLDSEAAAKPTGAFSDYFRNGAEPKANGTDHPAPANLLTKDRH